MTTGTIVTVVFVAIVVGGLIYSMFKKHKARQSTGGRGPSTKI